ncbi:MAG TPA: hypothetical protein VLC09_20245, partial [Polyangiaceae bacterium]|nr:hypothetical protein [Polyangiaceae bacterium]
MSKNTTVPPRRSLLRRLLRGAAWLGALLSLGGLYLFCDAYRALGHAPSGEDQERLRQSPQYSGERFVNRLPTEQPALGPILRAYWKNDAITFPQAPLPIRA